MYLKKKGIVKPCISLILGLALILSVFIGLPVKELRAEEDYVENLRASVDHATRKVTIRWDKLNNADGYYIFRMFDGDSYMPYIAYTLQNEYSEIPEKAGFVYYLVIPFQIRNGKQFQGTYKTNTYSYTAPPKAKNLQVQLNGNMFHLSWNPSPGASRYFVTFERQGDAQPIGKCGCVKTETQFQSDRALKKGEKFIFKVQPYYDGRGISLGGPVSYTYYVVQEDQDVEPEIKIPLIEENFPDPTFLGYAGLFDTDGDGYLSLEELEDVTEMHIAGLGITTLKGIEYFTNLEALDCESNALDELNLANQKSLTALRCSSNQITDLDLSENPLLYILEASNNNLHTLDLSQNPKLLVIYLERNPLLDEVIFGSHPNLELLDLNYTQIDQIDVSQFTSLTHLDLCATNLTSLDVTNLASLNSLYIGMSYIYEIDLSHNYDLQHFYAYNSELTSIDFSSNPNLQNVNVGLNGLTDIDLSNLSQLATLDVSSNLLTELDISNNPQLTALDFSDNYITELDISNNPFLDPADLSKQLYTP